MNEQTNGSSGGDGWETRWEAFSDYRQVSASVARSVESAVDAYATVEALAAEGSTIQPKYATRCRQRIMSAAMKMLVELDREVKNDSGEPYEEILRRWTEGDGGEDSENGFIDDFREHSLRYDGVPPYLAQFIMDIRTVAWELGYLQAGREQREIPDDPIEHEARSMFDDL